MTDSPMMSAEPRMHATKKLLPYTPLRPTCMSWRSRVKEGLGDISAHRDVAERERAAARRELEAADVLRDYNTLGHAHKLIGQ